MPLNKALIGKEYPASAHYEVGREKIRDFATAIGDFNPIYHDEAAAKAAGYDDIIAPPTFLTTLGFKFGPQVVGDPELGLNYAMVVHGEQEFEIWSGRQARRHADRHAEDLRQSPPGVRTNS